MNKTVFRHYHIHVQHLSIIRFIVLYYCFYKLNPYCYFLMTDCLSIVWACQRKSFKLASVNSVEPNLAKSDHDLHCSLITCIILFEDSVKLFRIWLDRADVQADLKLHCSEMPAFRFIHSVLVSYLCSFYIFVISQY